MQSKQGLSVEEIRAFLKGSDEVHFEGQNREEIYGWVNETLRQQHYSELGRTGRGVVRGYLGKMTGLSRTQVTRLITQYQQGELVKLARYRWRRFPTLYTQADVTLLAEVDEAHETLSGPATQKILQREFYDFADGRYQRLARVGGALVSTTPDRRVPQAADRRPTDASDSTPWANDARRGRKDDRDTCAWIRSTKATGMESRGYITSTPWTK